jgi:Fe(3+) dicitrate transport protein
MRHNTGDIRHDMEIGLRIHSDEQDRFQREDLYQMTGGVLSLTARGADGSESNRISSADAIATYFQNRMEYGALAVTPGVRYEYIELTTEDYGKTDPTRSGNALQQFDSTITAVIPGVGVEYNLTPQWQVLGGVHKGFNPPEPPTSAANNVQEEESVNYEAGLRFKQNALKAEAIGFFTDYENLLGSDNFSAGGGATGDQFNGGKVEVMGLEANLRYDFSTLIEKSAYRYPVKLTYTYTDATFQSSFNSGFAEWGNVRAGDELPYLPPHQFYVSAGVEQDDWAASISAKYNQKIRTVAGSGPLNETNSTDSNTVFDVNGEVEVSEGARVFGTVQNLFNEKYIAAARPAGFRPGAPQIVFVGLKTTF